MKILCDVCEKDEASFYCTADEASLCAGCDHRVHHANKLAGKHHRFSLLHPSPKQSPLCDICKERTAFLFCQQDRAILCKECDFPIHKANEHTQKHTRFLLTGVKLSATSALYSDHPPHDAVPKSTPSTTQSTTEKSHVQLLTNTNGGGAISTSSISEYLIETLPGWHVEDFLDSSSHSSFCQGGENDMLPFWDGDMQKNMSVLPTENMGFWVPQVAPPPLLQQQTQNQCIDFGGFGLQSGYRENNNMKTSSRKRMEDNSFAVPQISPSIKRSRNFWYNK